MKQKLLTLMTLLLTVCSGAWAATTNSITLGYSFWGRTSETAVSSSQTFYGTYVDSERTFNFSINFAAGTLKSGLISVTKKNNAILTITAPSGYNITKIITTFSSGKLSDSNYTSTDPENTNDNPFGDVTYTWDGSANSVAQTFNRQGGVCEIKSVVITYESSVPAGPTISASNVNIEASATDGNIAYTINNPVAGGKVTAAKKGTFDWLTVDGTETTSPIPFTAAENTGAERSATVTLTYTYNTSETVEKDVTITQAAKTYTITYNKGTYGTGEIAAGQKNHGVAFTLSSEKFTRAGYEQTGWATSDGGIKAYELGGSYTDNADITLYPVWEEAKYTVIYNVNGGGSCATASETQASAGAELTLPTPTWTGYTFDGWYNAGSKIGDAGAKYTPTANITLYAKWTDNIEGKIFSYVDGNYGDKFQAFDGSGWVDTSSTGTVSGKDKTFTHATTGAQFIIEDGAWDKKTNAISALAKLVKGTSAMSIIIPTGYQATVKILYGAYGTGNDYKMTVNGTDQASPNAKFDDGHTNAQIASDMKEITLNNQSGTLNLSVKGSKNIYIGRVAVTLTHVSATIGDAGYATFSSTQKLNFTGVSGLTAYKATTTSENSVTLEDVTGVVPAETGLLLKGAKATYYIPVSTADPTAIVTGNKLQSTASAAHNITNEEVDKAFVFGSLNGNVGFYKAAEGKTIGVGKSYLLLSGTGAKDVEFLSFVFGDEEQGETDGIKAVSTKVENGVRYNLAGQKVGADYKGIVIVNGKKVIIK